LLQQLTFKLVTLDKAEPALKDIEKELRKVPIAEWEALRLANVSELTKLKWDLEYLLKEPNIRSNNGVLIGFRDRMYKRLFEGIDIINERKVVTNTFNEFIKGITYFAPVIANSEEPVYHRDGSCPPRDMPNLTCESDTLSPSIKKRVYTCYIERLIYDELWLQMMGMHQNAAHLRWLQDTTRAFRTCFTNTTVSVSIRLVEGKPDNVAITIEDDSGKTTELYEKAYFTVDAKYDTKITGIKAVSTASDGNLHVVAVKTNTYEKEGTWEPINSPRDGKSSSGGGQAAEEHMKRVLEAIIKSRRRR